MKTFGEWLVQQLLEQDITQAELARRSGLSRQAISNYINDRDRVPEKGAVIALSRGLHIPVAELWRVIYGINDEKKNDPLREKLGWIASLLPDDEVAEIVDYANMRMEKMVHREEHRPKKNNDELRRDRAAS